MTPNPKPAHAPATESDARFGRDVIPQHARMAPVLVALIVTVLTIIGANRLGAATMVVITGAAILAYGAWLLTSRQRPIERSRILTPFLLLVAMELIHMAEEQVTDFPADLGTIFDIPKTFDLVAHATALMGAVNALALLALIGLRARHIIVQQLSSYMIWFYVLGPGMVNAVAHLTFPFIAGTPYFSGLLTVALPTVAGVWTLRELVRNDIKARRHDITAQVTAANAIDQHVDRDQDPALDVVVATSKGPRKTASRPPIIVCYDGSSGAVRAVDIAGRLFAGNTAIVLNVFSTAGAEHLHTTSVDGQRHELIEEVRVAARHDAASVADEGARLARDAGLKARPLAVPSEDGAANTIIRVASKESAAAIVILRTHRTGLRRLLRRSLSCRLLHKSPMPIISI